MKVRRVRTMTVKQFRALMLAIFVMGAVTGWICNNTQAAVGAWKAAAEAYAAERNYYNTHADAIISAAETKIKEKKAMEATNTNIPEGYMEDSQGRLVPVSGIKAADLARNDLVIDLMSRAKELSLILAAFKQHAMADIEAFVELSGEEYGAKLGGKKGNVTMYSFDGRFKLIRSIDDYIVFDERLQAAKSLIDECLKRWTVGSQTELRTIVNDAFQVDKTGRINTKRVLSLRRLDIQDETWQRAMQAISDSVQVISSKSYIRFYERQPDGSYKQLNLNIAT